MLITIIIITLMKKNPTLYLRLKDYLFRFGLCRKKAFVIQKADFNTYVTEIREEVDKTHFRFCNNIDNSLLFDDAEAACSLISVYNYTNFAIDDSGNAIQYKCFLVPVMAWHRYNKNTVSKIS